MSEAFPLADIDEAAVKANYAAAVKDSSAAADVSFYKMRLFRNINEFVVFPCRDLLLRLRH